MAGGELLLDRNGLLSADDEHRARRVVQDVRRDAAVHDAAEAAPAVGADDDEARLSAGCLTTDLVAGHALESDGLTANAGLGRTRPRPCEDVLDVCDLGVAKLCH